MTPSGAVVARGDAALGGDSLSRRAGRGQLWRLRCVEKEWPPHHLVFHTWVATGAPAAAARRPRFRYLRTRRKWLALRAHPLPQTRATTPRAFCGPRSWRSWTLWRAHLKPWSRTTSHSVSTLGGRLADAAELVLTPLRSLAERVDDALSARNDAATVHNSQFGSMLGIITYDIPLSLIARQNRVDQRRKNM